MRVAYSVEKGDRRKTSHKAFQNVVSSCLNEESKIKAELDQKGVGGFGYLDDLDLRLSLRRCGDL